ncbi:hypothetical protein AGMMS50229_16640 [Campylobacterota bacterium]|nr:hypothetical protein AGMMS50229_16640 [Campylobacterota bacterium]
MFKCAKYAEANGRILYIDTERSGFLDSFDNYFTSLSPTIHLGKLDFLSPPFDVFPSCLSFDITTYQSKKRANNIYRHSLTNIPLTFDFSKSYAEQILVHEHSEGGEPAVDMLEKLKLKENIRQYIEQIISGLGEYDAIHIRNTDFKTDYKKFFSEINDRLGARVVVCTDDLECQTYAKSFFGKRLSIVADIPDTRGKTLHCNKDIDRFHTNLITLCDLFVLACGQNLYFTHIEPDKHYSMTLGRAYLSGFSRLANALHQRPSLIQRLLYDK